MKPLTLILFVVPFVAAHAQPGWVVEQTTYLHERIQFVISGSAVKRTVWQDNALVSQTFADFGAGTVAEIDYRRKTIARTSIAGLLEREGRQNRYSYKAGDVGSYAGLPCSNFSYSYNSGSIGGWGGGAGCFTKAITMRGPHERQFQSWLWEGGTSAMGFALWFRASHDGPPREIVKTVSAVRRPIPANEFLIPAESKGFQSIPYNRSGN